MQRIKTWFKGLTMTGKITSIAIASVMSLGTFSAIAQPSTLTPKTVNAEPAVSTPAPQPQPKIEIKTVTATEPVAFTSSSVDDPTLTQGVTQTRTTGVNGERTFTYEVTLTDGVETVRREVSNIVTTQPVNEVIAKGTKVAYVQPSCPNGTYINTAGNTVCSPYESQGPPAGATAQCEDGTYSFSQSRRGTCSHHGGVAIWL